MERISHGVMVHSEILASVAAVIRAAEPVLVEPLHRSRQRRLFNPVRFRGTLDARGRQSALAVRRQAGSWSAQMTLVRWTGLNQA